MAVINFGGEREKVVTRKEFTLARARRVLKKEVVAVIGYGVQGPAQSLNMRDNGLNVIVGQSKEFKKDWDRARKDGWKPGNTLFDIAEAVEMHESTISRVTTQKYMHTPRGTFEFKYFFSSHVSTASGGEASATAIRALIKKLIGAEKPNKPLSDNKIAAILADQGINVARRTVAKYRESMAIPPSNERKRLA